MLTESYPMFRATIGHAEEDDVRAALAKEVKRPKPRVDMVLRMHARLTVMRRIRERELLLQACMRPLNPRPTRAQKLGRNR